MPPYSDADTTRWSPAWPRFSSARVSAACPLAVASAPTPPSSAVIRSSNTAWVGFMIRV